MLDTLPERFLLARQQKMPHQDFLLLIVSDEASRRDSQAISLRASRAHLEPTMQLEAWDSTANVTLDQELLNELVSLRFLDAHRHLSIVGPVGVGKTFLAHALGHIACRRGASVLALRADRMLKTLKHSRLDNSYEAELRKLLSVDLLVIDDFCLDAMDPTESRDTHEVLIERHRSGSIIFTSNRGPDEWLAAFADPARAPRQGTERTQSPMNTAAPHRCRQQPASREIPMSSCVGSLIQTRNNPSWAILGPCSPAQPRSPPIRTVEQGTDSINETKLIKETILDRE